MIVNLRGCSGAGKSWPGFQFMAEYPPVGEVAELGWFRNKKKPKRLCHILPGGLALAGRYVMKASTRKKGEVGYSGGLDGYYPMDELQAMLEYLLAMPEVKHLYFESLMISGTFQRWLDFSEEHGGPEGFTFATLDTPLETCVARVLKRNGGRPVKEDQIEGHRNQVHRCAWKFTNAGARSLMIDHRHSYEQLKAVFLEAGWDPSV
jgi:hypothetical protein